MISVTANVLADKTLDDADVSAMLMVITMIAIIILLLMITTMTVFCSWG